MSSASGSDLRPQPQLILLAHPSLPLLLLQKIQAPEGPPPRVWFATFRLKPGKGPHEDELLDHLPLLG